MLISRDGLIRVEVSKKTLLSNPGAADFSIVNLPCHNPDATEMLHTLINTSASKHVMLLLTRHRRQDRMKALSAVPFAESAGFEYLDTATIWYEKPSSCSNHGFLPVAEVGYIFYKGGSAPDVKQTEWFGDGTSNATNLWGVSPQENEQRPATYHQRFCWEVPLLLMSLAKPLEYRRFIYAAELSDVEIEPLFRFCKKFNMGVLIWAPTDQVADQWIRTYAETK
jgi:hypothetical protein